MEHKFPAVNILQFKFSSNTTDLKALLHLFMVSLLIFILQDDYVTISQTIYLLNEDIDVSMTICKQARVFSSKKIRRP